MVKVRHVSCFALGLLCIGFAIAGCIKSTEPATNQIPNNRADQDASQPDNPPLQQLTDERDWQAWVTDTPLKDDMRDMWIDCGLIVANSYYPAVADVEYLEGSADNIARKAGRIAYFWETIRDDNRAAATAASRNDFHTAEQKLELVHDVCGDCHNEYWPRQGRGFLPETIEIWHLNQSPFDGPHGEEPWGPQIFSAPPNVRAMMQRLQGMMGAAFDGAASEDKDEVLKHTKALNVPVEKQFQIWDGIRRHAEAIAELAQNRKFSGVGEHYKKMTQYCIDCHAENADGRGLDPLPWKQEE